MPLAEITLPFELRNVEGGSGIESIRMLFQEYQTNLAIDLSFQGFADEVATLPGAYSPPAGRLYLALQAGEPAACAAVRPLDEEACEIKRLYVRPSQRRPGIGRMLVQRALADARTIGYERAVLDTLATMHEAQRLYSALGFIETAPYAANAIAGTRFLALELRGGEWV